VGRPRAGNGLTFVQRGERLIPLLATVDGDWITTGEAVGWTRCARCRKPEEKPRRAPDGRLLCLICYYYKALPHTEFWQHKDEYLFPYNIGRRMTLPPVLRPKKKKDEPCPPPK